MDISLQKKFHKEVKIICQPIFDLFKITYFSHTRAAAGNLFTHLTTHPEILEFFFTDKYPISFTNGEGYFLNSGFYVESHMEKNLHSKEKLTKISKHFNINHIVYMIEKGEKYHDLYSFGTSHQNEQVINQYINNMHLLKQFILYYKGKSAPLLNKIQLIKYDDEYIMSRGKTNILTVDNALDVKKFTQETIVKKMQIAGKFGNVYISKREFECLKYLLKNNTQKEIAKIMILSPRTVETYINNLKIKLGYETQKELILLAEKKDLRIFI